MSRILAGIVIVALCFTLGYSQQSSVSVSCFNDSMCEAGQQCHFNNVQKAADVISVNMGVCMPVPECNKTNVMFSSNTNMCNTAAPLANTHTLTLAIASLSSLLLTKALV